ncbi:Receptor-like protein Cf-9 [Datura stramonium]|uniref:Receptor-like protein Cf-9 n=1 Tax=Datura stramonium TaxID=4076 RepID=A0ABS8VHL8_DATST|nr:Receptor-like protein Cf-9 [Datura stramonium]
MINPLLALLQFNHMFSINPNASFYCVSTYLKTLSQNKSTNCCLMDGVHCDEMTGQLIELNLTCSGLQSKFDFNSSLFQLSNLKRSNLSYNDFSGLLISPKFASLYREWLRA